MPAITCIEDLRRLYRARVPRMFYDYAETGSYSLQTFRDNVADFAAIRLRQRVGVDLARRSTQAKMLGRLRRPARRKRLACPSHYRPMRFARLRT